VFEDTVQRKEVDFRMDREHLLVDKENFVEGLDMALEKDTHLDILVVVEDNRDIEPPLALQGA